MFWIVGKFVDEARRGWEICGLYSTEEKAVLACEGEPEWFIGPLPLDIALPKEPTPWPGAYIPALRIQGITDYEAPL